MAANTDYALAMASGIASVAPTTATDPLTGGTMTALTTPWVDLGAISTAGITENLAESRTEFKRWGNITTFKSVITDEKHTFDVSFLESNANVLAAFYKVPGGITPSGTAPASTLAVTDDTTGALDVRSWVFDMLEGTNHIRFYVPRGEITARKNPVYKTDTLIEYGVTITAYPTSAGVAVKRLFLLDAVQAS
jgi:hypothetical protein